MPPNSFQRRPYHDWPLDRWKIALAVLLFLLLLFWRDTGRPSPEPAAGGEDREQLALLVTTQPQPAPIEIRAVGEAPADTPAVDPTAPDIALTLAALGREQTPVLPNSRPLLYGTAPPGTTVDLWIDDVRYQVQVDGAGAWQFAVPAPLPAGMAWIRAQLSSTAGPSEPTRALMVQIAPGAEPVAPPVLVPSAPAEQPLSPDSAISGEGPAGKRLLLYLRSGQGKPAQQIGQTRVEADGRWSWQPAAPLPPGAHLLWAVVVDESGIPLTRSLPSTLHVASAVEAE